MNVLFAVALVFISAASDEPAADPLACLDPLVAAAFLSGYGTQGIPSITQDIPATLDGVQDHEALSLIGVSVTSHSANVALESTQSLSASAKLVKRLLKDRGWSEIKLYRSNQRGFQAPGGVSASNNLTMCADGKGNMSVMTQSHEGTTIVNLVKHNNGYNRRNVSCDYQKAIRSDLRSADSMPLLELPENAKHAGGFGTSNSSRESSSNAEFELSMSGPQLLAHFDAQLEDQGWQFDSAWDGKVSHGSVWTRRMDKVDLVGVLTLFSRKNRHDAKFTSKLIER